MAHKAYGKPSDESVYFKANWFSKTLRFLNLMEPGRNVMSLSKMYFVLNMFCFFFVLLYVTIVARTVLVAVMAQGIHTTLALFNYMYRRHTMSANGHLAADPVTPAEPAAPAPPVDPQA